MRRKYLAVSLAAASVLVAVLTITALGSGKEQPAKPDQEDNRVALAAARSAPLLPVTGCALFSSGVGYFQREAEIEGSARVDLTFPVTDINDLLQSMVPQDLGGGLGALGMGG